MRRSNLADQAVNSNTPPQLARSIAQLYIHSDLNVKWFFDFFINACTNLRSLREAIPRLPRGQRYSFVRIGHGDRIIIPGRSEYTHDHFPDYLITPPAGHARTSTIREWNESPDWSAPAYFYSGVRCYARMRSPAVPPPHGENYHEACQQMRARYVLEPVVSRTVPNRGDVWLEYYGDAPTMTLTLYRVRPRP